MTGFGRKLEAQRSLEEDRAFVATKDVALIRPTEAAASWPAAVDPIPPPGNDVISGESQVLRLRTQVLERVNAVAAGSLSPDQLRAQISAIVHDLARRDRLQLSARDQDRLAQELADEMVGFGPLEPLLRDDRINDVMVNGPNRVFVEVDGKVSLSPIRFRDGQQLAGIAQKMASAVGRRVDEASPLVDCRLHDGSRVNIVFPPLALDGVCISIRKFSRRRYTLDALVSNGSMTPPVARILEIAARCRLNIVVSGGTGSGKTTLLNAMSQMIDHSERIVTIEDAAELQLQQPHIVRLETRPVNLEGKGEIVQRDLLRNALRMRPDRIIIGECRFTVDF